MPKRKNAKAGPSGKRRKLIAPEPTLYQHLEGHAHIRVAEKRFRIQVLLDSGSNVFVINEKLVQELEIPCATRQDPNKITRFAGIPVQSSGTKYTTPLKLQKGKNHHITEVSCEVAPTNRWGMIIPYGWTKDHPISNMALPNNWEFQAKQCRGHIGPGDWKDPSCEFEWDDDVAYEPEARMVGLITAIDESEQLVVDKLPKEYLNYADLFLPATAEKLPPRRTFDHAIDLKEGTTPPWGPIYKLSAAQLDALQTYLNEMMEQGKIRPSMAPCGAPILFVPKPNGGWRLCIDYRGLNKVTVSNKYPLPLMTELRDRVVGSTIFTKFDLKDGFHLIRIKEGDEWKTAFRTRYGHFEYKVMPFGLVNAPATFQMMMNTILREFLDHGVVVYMDDNLIYSKNEASHVALVRKVLSRLHEYQLAVSIGKSYFHVTMVDFLGYVVTTKGVSMSQKKVDTIQQWKQPKLVKDIQIFMGFANFYRRFIKDFSAICKPITELLKGNSKPFLWGREQDNAFEFLKKQFITAPILCHFDPMKETIVETNASDFALGYILSQVVQKKLHPVAFHSRKFGPAERNYDVHDKELLAIVEWFNKWRHYLAGTVVPITVYTDHQNLQYFLTTKAWSARQIRWAQKLADFNFRIVYCPGTRGGKPDALSRRPEYHPEGRAMHSEQSILKPENFVQVAIVWKIPGDNPTVDMNAEFDLEKERILETQNIWVHRLSKEAKIPTRRSTYAAGHDLYSTNTIIIPA